MFSSSRKSLQHLQSSEQSSCHWMENREHKIPNDTFDIHLKCNMLPPCLLLLKLYCCQYMKKSSWIFENVNPLWVEMDWIKILVCWPTRTIHIIASSLNPSRVWWILTGHPYMESSAYTVIVQNVFLPEYTSNYWNLIKSYLIMYVISRFLFSEFKGKNS